MRFWIWIGRIEGGLATVGAGLALLAMMLITILGVFGRYVLGTDLVPGGYNLIERVAFPLLVFWALPMAHREGRFPRFDMLAGKLSRAARRRVNLGVLLVELVLFLILFWFVSAFAWDAVATQRQMQIGTELWAAWPVMLMMPLAFALMLLEMARLCWWEWHYGPAEPPGAQPGS